MIKPVPFANPLIRIRKKEPDVLFFSLVDYLQPHIGGEIVVVKTH